MIKLLLSPRPLFLLLILLFSAACNSDDDAGNLIDPSETTSIPDPVFEQFLIDQGIDDLLDGSVSSSAVAFVQELDMTDIPVADLTGLEDFGALRKFLVKSQQLTSFNPNPNTQLSYLNTNGCVNLEALNVNALTELDTLYMSNNNSLVSLDVSQNVKLRSLHVISENLESFVLPEGETDAFIDLILFKSKVSEIDLSPFGELEKLRIDDNQLSSLDLSANPNLMEIDCSGNPLTSLNLANGMNMLIETMDATNSNLDCIQIDQGFEPPANGSWLKDASTEYSDDCT